jgi:hypothetical protein
MSALPATLRGMPLGRLSGQNTDGVLARTIVALAVVGGIPDPTWLTRSTMVENPTTTLDTPI